MSKNIINSVEHFSDISYFPNKMQGAYNPKPRPNPVPKIPAVLNSPGVANPPSVKNPPSVENPPSGPPPQIIPYIEDGVSYVDIPQLDKTVLKSSGTDYGNYTLRMYKLPADLNGNFIPVTKLDPTTNESTPVKFDQPMDNVTGRYNKQSFMIGLNTALIECSKFQDQCYAVVIPDQGQSSYYTYYLAQKPPSNNKSPDSDNENFLCNQGYVSYIKDKTQSGRNNLMSSTVSCDFNKNQQILYSGAGVNPTKKEEDVPSVFKYKDANKVPREVEQPPYLLYIGIAVVIVLVAGGIYYYKTQVEDDKPVTTSISTSKLLKKKGGYFFFV
jgi:hypothetical protein